VLDAAVLRAADRGRLGARLRRSEVADDELARRPARVGVCVLVLPRAYGRGMDWNCDSEHRSTYHLLTNAPALARMFDETKHVNERGGIEWEALEAECFSPSERLLARVGSDLWNGSGKAPLGELLAGLDEANYAVVVEAMRLRRGATSPRWLGPASRRRRPAWGSWRISSVIRQLGCARDRAPAVD
jgi:hypothetical protein